jgi:zinc transport system substrate-binding protein
MASAEAALKVVTTSKPVHALVASVMGDTGTPTVLVSGAASPHSYAMKPSDAKAANGAQLFFRISEGLEPFTAKLVKSLPKSVNVVSLIDAPGLAILDRRETGAFDTRSMVTLTAPARRRKPRTSAILVWLDPSNASAYRSYRHPFATAEPANAARFATPKPPSLIAEMSSQLALELKPHAGKPFVVLHDAYQYLERPFGLAAVGSIAVTPEAAPSGKRLAAIREKIADSGAVCVFAEPGMQPKVVAAVVEGSSPDGCSIRSRVTRVRASYALMRGLADGIKSCFAQK